MRNVTFTALLAATAVISSCGYIRAKTGAGDQANQIVLELTGTWDGPCYNRALLGAEYNKDSVEFLPDGGFLKRTRQYTDASCNTLLLTQDISGTYNANLGDVANVPNAKQINYTITGLSVRPESDDAAKKLNDAKYCTITDWKSEESKDILGKDCPSGKNEKGEVLFDIYSRDGNTIKFGDTNFWFDGSSAKTRPTTLDNEHPFNKR